MSDAKPDAVSVPAQTWHAMRGTGLSLIVGILLLGATFWTEIVAAVQTWNDSTAYNHCFLVIPIVLYMVWDRRDSLAGLAARPIPWVMLAGMPLAVVWLAAERLGIMEGRQLVAMTFLELLFLGVLGWKLWRAVCGPLLYLYFLVPFGEFLTPKLQDVTTIFVRHGLEIVGIPAYIDGYVIEIAEGTFYVAEACAGLRFLIAAIAFGALYAILMYRSPIRRAVFIAISVVVPVIANGFRAMGIVVLGHVLGSAEAAAADHILYGWIFFSIVILLLLACGLPFREDRNAGPPPSEPMTDGYHTLRGALASALLLIAAAASPVAAALLDRAAATTIAGPIPLDPGPSCTSTAGPPPKRARAAMGGTSIDQRITCADGESYDVHIAVFSPRSTAGPVMAERRRLGRPIEVEETREVWMDQEPHVWRLLFGSEQAYAMAIGLWIDGRPSQAGLSVRARMAWSNIAGADKAPIVVSVTPVVDWAKLRPTSQQRIGTQLTEFLNTHKAWESQIRAMAERR